MNPIFTAILIYLVGVIVAAFVIRYINSKEKYRHQCGEPPLCLLSWIIILGLCIGMFVHACEHFLNKIDYDNIEKFFNYTNKE